MMTPGDGLAGTNFTSKLSHGMMLGDSSVSNITDSVNLPQLGKNRSAMNQYQGANGSRNRAINSLSHFLSHDPSLQLSS
jgi:hypothetical protein